MDYQYLEKTSMCYRCENKEICKTVYQADDLSIQQANWNCSHFKEHRTQGDLISREALKKAIQECEKEPNYQHDGETWQNGLYIAETLVDNAPTVTRGEE